jgi:glycolate oxidase
MEKMSSTVVLYLENIVGKENVSESVYERIAYASDPMPYDLEEDNIPGVVVKPGSTREVGEIMNYANKHRIPVVIHGSGTEFNGASRPKRKGSILLSTSRLDFLNIDEDYMYFECGAGVRCIEVVNALEKQGYMLPLNPGSKMISTMGGLISINTIGHMVDACVGKPVDHVMGLEVVLPTGEILQTGTKSMRRPAGIDLTRFFASTDGLFGIITKIRKRLMMIPKKLYAVASFKMPEDVAHAFVDIYRKKAPIPLYGEFLDKAAAQLGFKMSGLEPPMGSIALATAVGRSVEEALRNAERLCDIFRERGSIDAYIVENEVLQQKIWSAREFILHLVAENKGNWTAIEVAPALPYLAEALHYLKHDVPKKLEVLKNREVYTYGHLGACSLHGLWVLPREWSNDMKRKACKEAFKIEKEMNIKYEGCGGELGQLSGRIPFFREKYGETGYSVVVNLKKIFDPNNLLNPGNLEGEGI